MPDEDRKDVKNPEVLLRHCPNIEDKNFVTPIDYVTKERKLGLASLRIRQDEDGLSVYRKKILDEDGVPCASARPDQSQYIFGFLAEVVRNCKWNVFWDPQEDGTRRGIAHSLIAISSPFSYDKREHGESFNILRSEIIAAAKVVISPT
jgi:hypothetical protein